MTDVRQFNVTAELADLYCESTCYLMLHTELIVLDDSVRPALSVQQTLIRMCSMV